ncbi:hypothetical protein HEP86_01675 [Streptomyces sp. RPA4-5]|uniref:competence protein CoiA family protein n=1 Tax=Streptomyces sp. RPA4-5 TaxID=2721245 RepID=UPI00143E3D58|nr:hypothetical protein [Streptomyces sp. RPA4-5]QIY53449.1 hypothetical protein HEP86_01675 [Streptomyces sp. RPA4-5]
MANGVFHTGYGIEIELTHADLGHPDLPGLFDEITQPIDQRDRELLQCLEHHKRGVCKAEDEDRSPWMAIRRRTVDGRTTLVAAHLPVRQRPTAEESDKHKAMKERIARAADRHGLTAEVEARSTDGRVRNDVLVTGDAERIGWEAQYSPITAATVRRRSQAAADLGILPLWITNSDRAALINRAPWARVDDFSWKDIASPRTMLVRGGVRHLQSWKCSRTAERTCPANGTFCGQFHAHWELPALCLPQRPHTEVDQLVVTSADGEHGPMRIPSQRDPRSVTRVWVPADDRDEWRQIFGPDDDSANQEPEAPDSDSPSRKNRSTVSAAMAKKTKSSTTGSPAGTQPTPPACTPSAKRPHVSSRSPSSANNASMSPRSSARRRLPSTDAMPGSSAPARAVAQPSTVTGQAPHTPAAPAVPEFPVVAGSEVDRATALARAARAPAKPVLARMTARGVAVALNTGRTVGPDPAAELGVPPRGRPCRLGCLTRGRVHP